MKKTIALVIAILATFFTGCTQMAAWGPQISIETDIPLNTTSITVINNSDYAIEIMSDGNPATYHPKAKNAEELEKQATVREKEADELDKKIKETGKDTKMSKGDQKKQVADLEKKAEEKREEAKNLRKEAKAQKNYIEPYRFQRGDSITLRLQNTSRYGSLIAIQVKAYDKSGKMVGATSHRYSVNGYYKDSFTWPVINNDFNNYSWGW